LRNEDFIAIVNISLKLIKIYTVSLFQKCNYKLSTVLKTRGIRVIRDAMPTKVYDRLINKIFLDAKKMAYFLYIESQLLENWNSCLEIL
jgi:hypothetical protein